ncbi:Uncharacterised protein [Mycobacteroides abscessus subsp. abscessus]|nr:Uncharacterised protein [Mycobacteroides abscessus subsp. abscessus]
MMVGSSSGWLWLAGMTARPAATSARTSSGSTPSRAAMKRISGVTMPARAQASWVRGPSTVGLSQLSRSLGRPASRSMVAFSSVYGPEMRRTGIRSPSTSR